MAKGIYPRPSLAERVWSRVDKNGPGGCWIYTGSLNYDGYGQVSSGSPNTGTYRRQFVHRWVYEELVGPIPDGLTLDHLCRVRACCNPDHLEPVTSGENVLRGVGVAAKNKAKTHCPRGHEFTPENIVQRKNGWRECRTCYNERMRVYMPKRRKARSEDALPR